LATRPIADTKPGIVDIKWFEQGVPADPEHQADVETTLSWLHGSDGSRTRKLVGTRPTGHRG